MVRAIIGVILGYVVMGIVVISSLFGAFFLMGADRAYRPGSYEVTGAWLAVWFVVSVVAAVAGGFVCALVAGGPKPKAPIALSVIVQIFGAVHAFFKIRSHEDIRPTEREGIPSITDAMKNARQPPVVFIATPLIGAIGVIVGAKLREGESKIPPPG